MELLKVRYEACTIYAVCKGWREADVGDVVSFGEDGKVGIVEAVCNLLENDCKAVIDLLSESMKFPEVTKVYRLGWSIESEEGVAESATPTEEVGNAAD